LKGETYLFHGPVPAGSSTTADADTTWIGETEGDEAARLQPTAGDVDGDGNSDFLIGAPCEESVATNSGAVYLIHGPAPPGSHSLADADVKIVGIFGGDQAGRGVAIGGDLDGDGFDDVLLISGNSDTPLQQAEAVFAWYGPLTAGTTDLLSAAARLEGPGNTILSSYISPVGDTNGDGLDDFVTCLHGDGECFLVRGPVSGVGPLAHAADVVFLAEDEDAGLWIRGGGHANDDGVYDYVFGAPSLDEPFEHCGATYLFYGPVSGVVEAGAADVRITGTEHSTYAFYSGLGDLNGDGLDDLLVGASHDAQVDKDAGALFVFYGGGL